MNFYSFVKAITQNKFAFYVLSKKYIEWYEGFSYNFNRNGEESFLNALSSEPINVVFDVGANVGDWTKMALEKFPHATVHAFELSDRTYRSLSDNLAGEDRVIMNNIGLSNQAGEIFYRDYGDNSGVNTIIPTFNLHDKFVKSVARKGTLWTGDSYCAEHSIDHIDLLKIDVEGAEHLVLDGFSEMMKRKAIRIIQFEYGYANGDAKFLMKDFYEILECNGYILGPLKPGGVLFMNFEYPLNEFKSGPNYVAVQRTETRLIEKVAGKPLKGFPN